MEDAGRQDAEGARARLISAGLGLFSAAGLEGVSTRQLAEAAGVNLAAIPYHFGGKEGVYLAVAASVANTSGAQLRALAERAGQETAPRSERLAALCAGVARVILSSPAAAQRGAFILREQIQPTAAFEILFEGFIGPLHRTLAALVLRPGESPDDAACVARAHAVLGQVLGFGMARRALLRRLGAPDIGAAEMDLIARTLAETAVAAASLSQENDL